MNLEEDWELLRNLRTTVSPLTESVEDDWRDIKGLPDWLYYPNADYGLSTMSLWRLKPRGRRIDKVRAHNEEFWTYTHDKLLWSGPGYKLHASTQLGRVYRLSVKHACLTLDAAFIKLEEGRLKHLETLRESTRRHEEEIRHRKQWIERNDDAIEEVLALRFHEGILQK